MRYCEHCGAPVSDQAKFCSACGKERLAPAAAPAGPVLHATPAAEPAVLHSDPAEASGGTAGGAEQKTNLCAVIGFCLSLVPIALVALLNRIGVLISVGVAVAAFAFSIAGVVQSEARGRRALATAGVIVSGAMLAIVLIALVALLLSWAVA